MKNEPEKFYLGLCMAGAVSAGAYTAGVMDYLLEALEKWEIKKKAKEEGVPMHLVEIPVIGGASAGGMTSVITAAALHHPHKPMNEPDPNNLLAENPDNILYHSWVDLTGVDMFTKMLDTTDIKKNEVLSVLNSNFIETVAERVIMHPTGEWQKPPVYFSNPLKVFTTLTNLQGFEYNVGFKADTTTKKNPYYMQIHNDFACFDMTDKTIEIPNKGWMPLNLEKGLNSEVAMNAAMATGAFPVGLQSRQLQRDPKYVNNNDWLNVTKLNPVNKEETYTSLNVDGGMLNNEPFDKIRELLNEKTGIKDDAINQNYDLFKSTVVMIAPFPSSKPAPISQSRKLLHVIGLTLSAMISQMRAKPEEFKSALETSCAGQFLIAPSRQNKLIDSSGRPIQGEKAIACGALGGFSGFLNKRFRVHDYFLGRHNCKIFLRDYFTIPESALEKNSIFSDGYKNCDRKKYQSTIDNSYQIIPQFEGNDFFAFPDFKLSTNHNWPIISKKEISKFRRALKNRIQQLILNIVKINCWWKIWLWLGSYIVLRPLIANNALKIIEDALDDWKLLEH